MGLKIFSAKSFLAAGPGYGTENFWCQNHSSFWAWLWVWKFWVPKSFLAAGLGYGIFLDFRVLSFSRACTRVRAWACVCVRARKPFLSVGGDFLAFRARVRARVRIRARKPFSCFQGHFFSFFARACVRTRTHARYFFFFYEPRSGEPWSEFYIYIYMVNSHLSVT